MKKNVGSADKVIRFLVAIAAALLMAFNVVTGTAMYIVIAVGAIALLTGLFSRCGLYAIFGASTCKVKA